MVSDNAYLLSLRGRWAILKGIIDSKLAPGLAPEDMLKMAELFDRIRDLYDESWPTDST